MTSPDRYIGTRNRCAAVHARAPRLVARETATHAQTVCEYDQQLLTHALQQEQPSDTGAHPYSIPSLDLFSQQPEINLRMRPLLLDYLMEIIHKLKLHAEVFYTTVNLIDRYCSIRIVRKQHFQLLGLTALWLASKLQENKLKIVSLNDLLAICCHCYAKTLFVEMEQHILKSLGWMINAPTVNLFTTLLTDNSETLHGCSYLGELSQFYPAVYYKHKASAIAQCAIDLVHRAAEFDATFCAKGKPHSLTSAMVQTFTAMARAPYAPLTATLVKYIKCPPPSLKVRYFDAPSRTMTQLLQFANFHKAYVQFSEQKLMPSTPRSDAGIGAYAISTPPSASDYFDAAVTPVYYQSSNALPSPEWSPGNISPDDCVLLSATPVSGYTTPPITPHEAGARKRSHPLSSCVSSTETGLMMPAVVTTKRSRF